MHTGRVPLLTLAVPHLLSHPPWLVPLHFLLAYNHLAFLTLAFGRALLYQFLPGNLSDLTDS